ncbi:hypothetical protein BQ8482_430008 [Mesorhizobium delmotii]|uniref:Uncharacterized protein n=1 Tax=Mesorhizobium delmotii TaxID=1631247 RepID=A0A2P9ATH3_9HYPH|nr:hypothetical protein BQ8482_430008 [Mesorhizobium delmotii]
MDAGLLRIKDCEGRFLAWPGRPAAVRNGLETMLKDMKDGKAPPGDPTHTGLDICTPETADTCIAK